MRQSRIMVFCNNVYTYTRRLKCAGQGSPTDDPFRSHKGYPMAGKCVLTFMNERSPNEELEPGGKEDSYISKLHGMTSA